MLAKTGLTVAVHQVQTVTNYLELRSRAPDLPFVPVLQGWSRDDYHRCVELYDRADINLAAEPLVGVGSICRRQGTGEIEVIVHSLASIGLRLHGFGVEAGGLVRYADCLVGGFAGLELRGTTDATVARLPSLQLRELPTVCGGVAGAHARSG